MRKISGSPARNSLKGIIARPALMKKMRDLAARHVFISAPGGYGKTVAATQWLASAGGDAATMTANGADNDPGVFFTRLAQALCRLVGVKAPAAAATAAEIFPARFPARRARRRLLIDDLHRIENDDVIGGLALIAARLPGYARLCLASRTEPPDALAETGLFAVLTRDDLRFSPEEAEWLAAEKERALTKRQIHDLLDTTGGWPMYLSALLSDGRVDGVPESLSRYLETRVWALWDDEVKEALIALAVPPELTPELCGRLTGRTDGRRVLEALARKENTFLSRADGDHYRFHEVFREFLLARAEKTGADGLRRLNALAAAWFFEQGDYLAGARHYINNRDHDGISRCLAMTFRTGEKESGMSVDMRHNFTVRHIVTLPDSFIAANPYLLIRRALAAYHGGNIREYQRYADMLGRRQPEIAREYPDLAIICRFMGGLDPRTPLRGHVRTLAAARSPSSGTALPDGMTGTGTITHNLPLFHRSMRDLSEYHELNPDDLALLRDTLGVFLGGGHALYEQCLMAGIHYEKGDLLTALHHALNARRGEGGDATPEIILSSGAILAETLYALGAANEAKRVLGQAGARLSGRACYLMPNLRALQAEHAVRAGNAGAAQEWLAVHAVSSGQLPFYQLPRHFTTLRAYLAMEYFASAIRFGNSLRELAAAYRRPLCQIESGILLAVAARAAGKGDNALEIMEDAVELAAPYGFIQLFLNEGRSILPLLLTLREKAAASPERNRFVEKLCVEISGHDQAEIRDDAPLRLSGMRRKMLGYLEQGLSYTEIAGAAGISPGTAKRHVLLLYKQLGVHSAEAAVAKAKMLGLE